MYRREPGREGGKAHVPVCLQGKQLAGAQRVSKMFAYVYLPVYVHLVVCRKGGMFLCGYACTYVGRNSSVRVSSQHERERETE